MAEIAFFLSSTTKLVYFTLYIPFLSPLWHSGYEFLYAAWSQNSILGKATLAYKRCSSTMKKEEKRAIQIGLPGETKGLRPNINPKPPELRKIVFDYSLWALKCCREFEKRERAIKHAVLHMWAEVKSRVLLKGGKKVSKFCFYQPESLSSVVISALASQAQVIGSRVTSTRCSRRWGGAVKTIRCAADKHHPLLQSGHGKYGR